MITLDLKDLLKNKVYIVRYGGKEHFKTNNLNTLRRLKRALNVLGIKDYHVYKINIEKVVKDV